MKIDHQLFRTGIPLIDSQHEQYLDLVDQLFEAIEKPSVDQAVVDNGLGKAIAYALEHFDAEEALMRSSGYPGYEKHCCKHDEFRDMTDRLLAMRNDNVPPADQLLRLTKWLVEWFYEQTRVHDKAVAFFLKKQGHPGAIVEHKVE